MDTRDKRASVLGFALASLLVLPSPGALDQGDRQQTDYSYRGISASAPVVDVATECDTIMVPEDDPVMLVPEDDPVFVIGECE